MFPISTYLDRISRVRVSMASLDLGALVVGPSSDLLYLCGYSALALERPTLLIVRVDGDCVLVVPRLERARVPEIAYGVAEVVCWEEDDDPFDLVGGVLEGVRRIAAGDQMWASHLIELQRRLGDVEVRKASEVVSPVRAVKEPAELELLRRAAECADTVAARLDEIVLAGMTEREAAAAVSTALLEAGNEEVGFVIVGSGPNSASPHHAPGDRKISGGDVVVCDFGGIYRGYRSDITRTMVIGRPPDGFEEAYELVRTAQQRGVEAAGAGTPAGEVDRVTRGVIADAGYGDHFIHRTGHGIGLDTHEAPYIRASSREILEESMCFSIEPGVYLEGKWGIRIEDIVVATVSGGVRLNEASRQAIRGRDESAQRSGDDRP